MKKDDITDPEERRNYEFQSKMFAFHRSTIKSKAKEGACKYCGGDYWVPILKRVERKRKTKKEIYRWYEWVYGVERCKCFDIYKQRLAKEKAKAEKMKK